MNVGKFSNPVARIPLIYDDAIHDVVDATVKSRQVTMATLGPERGHSNAFYLHQCLSRCLELLHSGLQHVAISQYSKQYRSDLTHHVSRLYMILVALNLGLQVVD